MIAIETTRDTGMHLSEQSQEVGRGDNPIQIQIKDWSARCISGHRKGAKRAKEIISLKVDAKVDWTMNNSKEWHRHGAMVICPIHATAGEKVKSW